MTDLSADDSISASADVTKTNERQGVCAGTAPVIERKKYGSQNAQCCSRSRSTSPRRCRDQ